MVFGVVRQRVWNCLSVSSRSGLSSRIERCVFLHWSSTNRKDPIGKPFRSAPWSVLFFGTDEFALQSLKKLNEQYRLKKLLCRLEVVTGYKGKENAVIKYANQHGIKLHAWPPIIPVSEFDIGLVVSFGHMIPKQMIESFPLGMLNVHASLLPKLRGAAPIIHCLMNGDSQTGVTIMKIMPNKFDIGEILAQEETIIHPDETMPELYIKLATSGADLLMKTIEKLPGVLSTGQKQSDAEATYARKVDSKIAAIKWDEMNAKNVYDLQRALTGLYPLTAKFQDNTIKVMGIRICHEPPSLRNLPQNKPGTVIYDKKRKLLLAQCKEETWISIDQVIIPGRKPMSVQDFRNGFIANQKEASILFQ